MFILFVLALSANRSFPGGDQGGTAPAGELLGLVGRMVVTRW
jgi:hypothetical protein